MINFTTQTPYRDMMTLRKVVHHIADDLLYGVFNRIMQKRRFYHGVSHILQMWNIHLQLAETYPDIAPDGIMVAYAILYHDAIYDAQAKDNEYQSAELWKAHATKSKLYLPSHELNLEEVDLVYRAIMATADHFAPREPNAFIEWIVGLDLASLACPREEFTANTQMIRMEYGHISDEVWLAGRGGFLKNVNSTPEIYRHFLLRDQFEENARANIKDALGI